MNLIRTSVSTNPYTLRLLFVLIISILLNGCAAIASVPVPIRIASNVHTGYTLYKNFDDNPDNDSWYVSYIKSFFSREKEEESLYIIADQNEPSPLNTAYSPKIKL